MSLLGFLASAGVWASLYPVGAWVLRRANVPPAIPAIELGLGLVVGVACWSVVMLGCVWAGIFSPRWLGVVGWMLFLGAAVLPRRGPQSLVRLVPWTLLIAGAAVLYALYPTETPVGDRDEGIYTARAVQIARTGSDRITTAEPEALAADPHRPFVNVQAFVFPGVYAEPAKWTWQFSALPSVWIAQTIATVGDVGLYRTSAIWAAIGLLAFLGLALALVPTPLALPAFAVFALNPAQVWVARINLSESLAQLLLLGGVGVALISIERRSLAAAAVAALLFAVGSAVRIDLVVVAPALAGAWLVHRIAAADREDEELPVWRALSVGTAIGCALGVAAYAVMSPPYLADNRNSVLMAGTVTLALFVVLAIVHAAPPRLRERMRQVSIALVPFAIAGLVVLFAYAALLRPRMEPFALIDRPGSPIHGLRDYREKSLVDLAAYLTWPVLLLALAGLSSTVRSAVRGGEHGTRAFLVALFGGSLFLFLTQPNVAPDHFWAIRRFVPVAIPGAILLATLGLRVLLRKRHRLMWPVGIVLTMLASTTMLWIQRSTLTVAQNRGLTPEIGEIVRGASPSTMFLLPESAIALGAPLLAASRRVLPLRDGAEYAPRRETAILERECTVAHPCRMISDNLLDTAGMRLAKTRAVSMRHDTIERTLSPLPQERITVDRTVLVSDLSGLDEEPAHVSFAVPRDWRVGEGGFHATELDTTGPLRWTRHEAHVDIPATTEAQSIEFRLHLFPVPGNRLRIAVNTTVLFDGSPPPGEWTRRFPLPAPDARGTWRVTLAGTPFVPAQLLNSEDMRTLAVGVRGIRLLPERTEWLTAGTDRRSFRSSIASIDAARELEVRSGQPATVRLRVVNQSDAGWGVSREQGVAVNLGLRWFRASDQVMVAEQRAPLAYGLLPRETMLVAIPVNPFSASGVPLPPGQYDVLIGPVAEGLAWFYERGDPAFFVRVTVLPRRT